MGDLKSKAISAQYHSSVDEKLLLLLLFQTTREGMPAPRLVEYVSMLEVLKIYVIHSRH